MDKKLLLIKNNKSIALLAPSFPIDFKFPAVIGMLREIGFDQVTELTYGARLVNLNYAHYIKSNPKQQLFIASPCPTMVNYITNEYPDLIKFLVPIVSPMAAMAKIYKKHHPDHKIVFFSPCYAKQNIEASKYQDDIDEVITFKELKEIFNAEGIKENDYNREYYFDSLIQEYTKIYPVSGGLSSTSHLRDFFEEKDILVLDGIGEVKKVLDEIVAGKSNYKFLDLLNCSGGCIGGPAINNFNLSVSQKKESIENYIKQTSEIVMGSHKGHVDYAKNVDLSKKF